jgi:hypothetical protein
LELNMFFHMLFHFLCLWLIYLLIDETLIKFLNELHLIVITSIAIGGTQFLILVFSRWRLSCSRLDSSSNAAVDMRK